MQHNPADRTFVRFGRLARPVAFVGCHHLTHDLPDYFRGWSIAQVSGQAVPDPIITVARTARGYSLTASWLDEPLQRRDEVDCVCALIAELVRASVDSDPGSLCLHAAAARIAGHLVVFPNRYRAGKSLLSACLAAHGARLLADDVVPLGAQDGHALASGILPRLRLPLPDNLERRTRAFIARHRGPRNDHYAYLDLPPSRLAPRGESAAIDGIVLLDRRDGGAASLEAIGQSEALRQIILQNFAREPDAGQILERLQRIVGQATCHRLTYARADDAARLLLDIFSQPAAASEQAPTPAQARSIGTTVDVGAGRGSFVRRDGLRETHIDGEHYLADARNGAIHHLDPIATAIWRLLDEATGEDEVVAALTDAFPGVPGETVARDVAALLDDLRQRDLIVAMDENVDAHCRSLRP